MTGKDKWERISSLEKKFTAMFDSDTRVGLALLEEIRRLEGVSKGGAKKSNASR